MAGMHGVRPSLGIDCGLRILLPRRKHHHAGRAAGAD